ncbi:MAG TPA: hypothetical protein VEG34_08065 [Thermoanaerobaculia bacterium]|nr:hypothetical protein [Thermoanaerobaculia bacterium]
MRVRRSRLSSLPALLLLAGLLAACGSPNRGTWKGTFDGSMSGTVEFRINSRGTALSGTFNGTTNSGQPFEAEMEGKINDPHFYATFEGTSRTEIYPVPFEGFLRGELGSGKAGGEWETQIRTSPVKMRGAWTAEQVAEEE